MRTPMVISPQKLCQELVRDDPWRVLCVCVMLNQTSGVQVRKVFPDFFRMWPTPVALVNAHFDQVKEVIAPLGFKNRRYTSLVRMSLDYMAGTRPPQKIYGVGKYAADSWTIFVEGRIPDGLEDKELNKYAAWARSLTDAVPQGLPITEEAERHGNTGREGTGRDHPGCGGVRGCPGAGASAPV